LAGNAPSCIPEVACGTPNANPTINMKLEWTNPLVSATVISSTGSPTTISSIGHGLTNGDEVVLSGFNTECSVNAKWTVTVVDVDTFTIPANVTNIINGVGSFSLTDTKSFLGCTWTNGETKEVYPLSYTVTSSTTPFLAYGEQWARYITFANVFSMGRFANGFTPNFTNGSNDINQRLNLNGDTYRWQSGNLIPPTPSALPSLGILSVGDRPIPADAMLLTKQKNNTFTDSNNITYTWGEGNGW
jgi:hypothetical protein